MIQKSNTILEKAVNIDGAGGTSGPNAKIAPVPPIFCENGVRGWIPDFVCVF